MFELDTYLPYKRNYKTIDGFRMHYVDEGSGPVVVLLHGNPTWCFYFRNLIKELSSSFRVIAPDYIGCGLSDHPENVHYRAVDRMRQVQDLLDSLGVNKLSLVMHDWGGPIGTGFAVRNPERIERIVYLNTTLTETESLPFIIKRAAAPYIGKVLTKYTRNFLKITTELGVFKKLPRAVQEGYFYPYQTSARRTAIWDFVQDIPFSSTHPTYSEMFDMAERIPLLKHVPVHIIWGMRDPCFHREMLSKVVGHYPHATVQELKDASHLLLEDAPETVIPAIKSFLLGETRPAAGLVGASREGGRRDPFNSAIQSLARERGDHDAVVVPTCFGESITYSHTTYRQFEALILKYARGLAELGLQQGDKVVMLVPPSVDFLALSFACIDRGAVPVFLDPGMGIDNLKRSIKEIRPAVFMGSVKAQILRFMNRDVFEGLKFSITAIDLPLPGIYTLSFLRKFAPLRLPAVEAGPISLIAFTSGATGAPKGVEYTPAMVDAVLDILRRQFGLQAGTRDMPMLPIFSLFNVALGVTSVFPPVDPSAPLSLDPIRIVRIVNDLSINYSFGSPTLWTKIAEYCVRSAQKLESIEKVFMAGAPVPEKTLALVQGVLPRGTAFTPYGATEALPVTLVSSPQLVHADAVRAVTGEEGTFVGMPVHGVVVKIIKTVQEPILDISGIKELPAQNIGEIIVKGANISGAYFQNDTATTNAKIRDGAGFWHRMGDVGYLDEVGNLYFCGRKAHVVAGAERTYYSDPVERVFNRHHWVRRSALIPVEGGKDAAVAIEPLPQHFPTESKDRAAFIAELREIGKRDPLTSQIEKFFFHPSFPVDARHNAKIFRDKLGRWADEMTHKGSDV